MDETMLDFTGSHLGIEFVDAVADAVLDPNDSARAASAILAIAGALLIPLNFGAALLSFASMLAVTLIESARPGRPMLTAGPWRLPSRRAPRRLTRRQRSNARSRSRLPRRASLVGSARARGPEAAEVPRGRRRARLNVPSATLAAPDSDGSRTAAREPLTLHNFKNEIK